MKIILLSALVLLAVIVASSECTKVLTTRELLEQKKTQLDAIKASIQEVKSFILADEYYPLKDRMPGFIDSQRQTLEDLTSTMKTVQYQVSILDKICKEKKGSNCDGNEDNVSTSIAPQKLSSSSSEQLVNGLTNQQKLLATLSNDVNSLKESLAKVSSNPWTEAGTLRDFEKLLQSHPTHHYQWGIKYNTVTVTPIVIQSWNKGIRIFPEISYSMGDNGSSLLCGKTIFTKDLLDSESQQGYFYQRYVDCNYNDMKYFNNHDGSGVVVYVRKF